MDARTIDILASLDPEALIPKVRAGEVAANLEGSPLHKQAEVQFLSNYTKLNFGWYIAGQFSMRRQMFPITMLRRDYWVFRAYLMRLDPWTNYDKHIAEAYHIACPTRGMIDLGTPVKALMMAYKDDHPIIFLESLARRTGLPYQTIEAFEALFYNVLDRREDALYIAKEVYPHSRLVEFDDSYFNNSAMGDLLKRAGYNYRDIDLTSYLIGMGDRSFMSKLAASENREAELSMHIMGNGLLLTRAHLLNQRSVGLSRASTLMVASRQSGSNVEDPALSGIAPLFAEELLRATRSSRDYTVEVMRSDAGGHTIDVTA